MSVSVLTSWSIWKELGQLTLTKTPTRWKACSSCLLMASATERLNWRGVAVELPDDAMRSSASWSVIHFQR